MIDIHSHIIPGVDDGSQSLDESLELLAIAAESGVDTIVATPHCNIPDEYENYAGPELEQRFLLLDRARKDAGISIRICRGMEVFTTEELPELLKNHRIWTLNGTRYFLMEFSFGEDPDFCGDILRQCRELGYLPIIAHPERYYFIQDYPQIAYEWCRAGYGLQLNKGSVLGRFGPDPYRCARKLLEHGLVACVASDAHSPGHRSTHMAEISDVLLRDYGDGYRHLLLEENPARILEGKQLLGYEPIPF